jgi:hypothetical protein
MSAAVAIGRELAVDEMTHDIGRLRADMREGFASLRTSIEQLRTSIEQLHRWMLVYGIGAIIMNTFAALGIILEWF